MRIILERHTCAPELNKAYIGPGLACFPVPGCTSIRDVRKKLFSPLLYKGRYVQLIAQNPAGFETYNRVRSGFCNDIISLAGAIHNFKAYHNIPDCRHIVKTRLIG